MKKKRRPFHSKHRAQVTPEQKAEIQKQINENIAKTMRLQQERIKHIKSPAVKRIGR